MSQEKPEHLKLIDDAEGEHYSSRAVFSDVGLGVEVKEYENFTLYHWRGDSGFDEVLNAVEPYFPLVENPALEMLEEKDALRYRSERDHKELQSDSVYDPVKDYREGERWKGYELIQLNLNGASVIWDKKEGETRFRVYEVEDTDVFEKLFPELEGEKASRMLSDIRDLEYT